MLPDEEPHFTASIRKQEKSEVRSSLKTLLNLLNVEMETNGKSLTQKAIHTRFLDLSNQIREIFAVRFAEDGLNKATIKQRSEQRRDRWGKRGC